MQRPSKKTLAAICKRAGCAHSAGRDLLVSSHAGTRLPIAAKSEPGRSPSNGPRASGALRFFGECISSLDWKEKSGSRRRSRIHCPLGGCSMLPTVGLSTSGFRVEAKPLSAVRHPRFLELFYNQKVFLSRDCILNGNKVYYAKRNSGELAAAG